MEESTCFVLVITYLGRLSSCYRSVHRCVVLYESASSLSSPPSPPPPPHICRPAATEPSSVSASLMLARPLTRLVHNFLSIPSFVWYTPFLPACFFIPDEERVMWVSFHRGHQTSSVSHQPAPCMDLSFFYIRCFSSVLNFVYKSLWCKKSAQYIHNVALGICSTSLVVKLRFLVGYIWPWSPARDDSIGSRNHHEWMYVSIAVLHYPCNSC